MRQAVILAGGKGTRLRERLGGRPKPLVDICGRPLLERQLLLLRQGGCAHVVVLVSHAADQVRAFLAGRDWGLRVDCVDDGTALGTAGAVLAARGRLDAEFLVLYGDVMLEVDLARFESFHRAEPAAAATLFLHPNDHPHDSDLVETDGAGRIVAFHPCPRGAGRFYPNLVNAGLYCVRRESLAAGSGRGGPLDFGKELFPDLLARGVVLRGYQSPEYIKDCGTPERLDRVCADLASGRVARSSLARPQPAVFLDRDGTMNPDVGHLSRAEQFELLPGVGEAVRRLNEAGYRSVLATNQPVVARGECSLAELQRIHDKLETLLGRHGAFLDRIYFCPHHPHGGFPGEVPELKVACRCRKPGTGMIERAAAELNIDLTGSWIVGDSTVDLMTAKNAGLRSILVQTGCAGLDLRYDAAPSRVLRDLSAAVDLIVGGPADPGAAGAGASPAGSNP